MTFTSEITFVHVDDCDDDIYLTERSLSRSNVPSRYVAQKKPLSLFETLDELVDADIDVDTIILLLDINMPRCNGFEMLRKVRKHEKYSGLSVIMLSSSEAECDIMEAFSAGCDGYISKPLSTEKLVSAVAQIPYSFIRLAHQS